MVARPSRLPRRPHEPSSSAWIPRADGMAEASRRASRGHGPSNVLFAVAAAENPPPELCGRVDLLTIHFPWGSLLRGASAVTRTSSPASRACSGRADRSWRSFPSSRVTATQHLDVARIRAAWAEAGLTLGVRSDGLARRGHGHPLHLGPATADRRVADRVAPELHSHGRWAARLASRADGLDRRRAHPADHRRRHRHRRQPGAALRMCIAGGRAGAALQRLLQRGRAFACACSRRDLALAAAAPGGVARRCRCRARLSRHLPRRPRRQGRRARSACSSTRGPASGERDRRVARPPSRTAAPGRRPRGRRLRAAAAPTASGPTSSPSSSTMRRRASPTSSAARTWPTTRRGRSCCSACSACRRRATCTRRWCSAADGEQAVEADRRAAARPRRDPLRALRAAGSACSASHASGTRRRRMARRRSRGLARALRAAAHVALGA